ncbi:MAG: gamma-glutamyl-gamma-aminobutyrate hydrolase family protein [Planctomycetes bacterium]|nr:gamma-glutamyl-gamma-aminobutyrate hydrolase family protein [Planctomycetota bacterium]
MRPRIAITMDVTLADGERRVQLPAAYAEAVAAAGGEPMLLPPTPAGAPADLPHLADALLLTGGRDLDTTAWGEPLHPKARLMDPMRQEADLDLLASADACNMPVLAICLGCQEMAVHRGGRIIQHLPDEPGERADHGRAGRPRVFHPVQMTSGSLLARLVGTERIEVNSRHHQAVREPGREMAVVARAPDGVIEAIEDPSPGRFWLGVQWHPEDMTDRPEHAALFQALCRAAAEKHAP